MTTKDILVKVPLSWAYAIEQKAKDKGIYQSQLIREAIAEHLKIEMNWVEFNHRAPRTNKRVKRHEDSESETQAVAVKLPRYMEVMLKEAAKSANVTISSLALKILYAKHKDLPSKPVLKRLIEGQWTFMPEDMQPARYSISVYVPKDWMPVLEAKAKDAGLYVSTLVAKTLLDLFDPIAERRGMKPLQG